MLISNIGESNCRSLIALLIYPKHACCSKPELKMTYPLCAWLYRHTMLRNL